MISANNSLVSFAVPSANTADDPAANTVTDDSDYSPIDKDYTASADDPRRPANDNPTNRSANEAEQAANDQPNTKGSAAKVKNSQRNTVDLSTKDPQSFVNLLAQFVSNMPVNNGTNTTLGQPNTNNTRKAVKSSDDLIPLGSADQIAQSDMETQSAQDFFDESKVDSGTAAQLAAQSQVVNPGDTTAANQQTSGLSTKDANNVQGDDLGINQPTVNKAINSNNPPASELNGVSLNQNNSINGDTKGKTEIFMQDIADAAQFSSALSAQNPTISELQADAPQSTHSALSYLNAQVDGALLQSNGQASLSNASLNQALSGDGKSAVPTQSLSIPVNVNNPQWSNQLSNHIVWLGGQEVKSASIKINPEDLGPIEISVKVDKDSASASVNIITHSAEVTQLVHDSLAKLKEMMADEGLNLSDVHVGSDKDANSSQFSQNGTPNQQQSLNDGADESLQQITPLTKQPPKGIIDYFA